MSVFNPPVSFGLAGIAAAVLISLSAPAAAENLKEVYEAAKAYDATYLAARAAAEASRHKAAQADALGRPTVNLQAGATHSGTDTPLFGSRTTTTGSLGVVAVQPLFNRPNGFTIEKARRLAGGALSVAKSADRDRTGPRHG